MVPAQVQQRPAKSTALPLPRTNPVPEVATTSMLDRRKNDSKRQVPKHEFKYHPFIKFKKRKEKEEVLSKQHNHNVFNLICTQSFVRTLHTTCRYPKGLYGEETSHPGTKNGSNSMKKGSSTHCDPIWPYRKGLIFETGSGLRSQPN